MATHLDIFKQNFFNKKFSIVIINVEHRSDFQYAMTLNGVSTVGILGEIVL